MKTIKERRAIRRQKVVEAEFLPREEFDAPPGRKLIFNGQVFSSIKALERELSFPKGSMQYALSDKNLNLKQAIKYCLKNYKPYFYSADEFPQNPNDMPPHSYCLPVTYNGVFYRSQQAAERALGMKKQSISRIRREYECSAVEAIERYFHPENFPPKERKPYSSGKPVFYKGVNYESRNACAAANGINVELLSKRLDAGWSVEEAIETPKNVNLNKGIEFNGIVYPNEIELCKAHNIGIQTFKQRLRDGWTFDVALTYPVPKGTKKSPVFYDGVVYPSIKDFARALNLKYNLLIVELRKGKSKADCVKNPSLILKEGEKFEDFCSKTEFLRQRSIMNRESLAYACSCSQYAMFEN